MRFPSKKRDSNKHGKGRVEVGVGGRRKCLLVCFYFTFKIVHPTKRSFVFWLKDMPMVFVLFPQAGSIRTCMSKTDDREAAQLSDITKKPYVQTL